MLTIHLWKFYVKHTVDIVMRKPKKFDVNKLRWRRVVVTFIDNRRPLPSSRFH